MCFLFNFLSVEVSKCSCYLKNVTSGYLNVSFCKHRKFFNALKVSLFTLRSLGVIFLVYFQISSEGQGICRGVFLFFMRFFFLIFVFAIIFSLVGVQDFVVSFLQRQWRVANFLDRTCFQFFVIHIVLFCGYNFHTY